MTWSATTEGAKRPGRAAMVLTVGMFFLWGMANNLNDVLIAHFRQIFWLGDLQPGLVRQAFYLSYFRFAIPAAKLMQRFGYRTAVVLGLILSMPSASTLTKSRSASNSSTGSIST